GCLIEVYAPGLPRFLARPGCSGSQQTIEEARLADVRATYESHRRTQPLGQVLRPVDRGDQRAAGRFLFQQSLTVCYCRVSVCIKERAPEGFGEPLVSCSPEGFGEPQGSPPMSNARPCPLPRPPPPCRSRSRPAPLPRGPP